VSGPGGLAELDVDVRTAVGLESLATRFWGCGGRDASSEESDEDSRLLFDAGLESAVEFLPEFGPEVPVEPRPVSTDGSKALLGVDHENAFGKGDDEQTE
jgi:hypothetical protein